MDSNYELSADKQPAVGKEKTSDSGEQERNNESVYGSCSSADQKYLLVAGFCEKPDHSDNELFKIGTTEYICNTYCVGELKFTSVASTNKAIIIIISTVSSRK